MRRRILLSIVASSCLALPSGAFPRAWSGVRAQARPEMRRIPQFDNNRATAWKSVIPPHTESTLHRHDRSRAVIAIVGGDLKTVSPDGRTTVTRYETGKAYWQDPMPAGETHRDVNDTNRTIELVVVEMK